MGKLQLLIGAVALLVFSQWAHPPHFTNSITAKQSNISVPSFMNPPEQLKGNAEDSEHTAPSTAFKSSSYDPLRYLDSPAPPELPKSLKRVCAPLKPVSIEELGLWQDEAAVAVLLSWDSMLGMLRRLWDLLQQLRAEFERMGGMEAVVTWQVIADKTACQC
jgi:hypothetical protein